MTAPPPFSLEIDTDRRLLICRLTGFWTAEIATVFLREAERRLAECRSRFGSARALFDLSDMLVQSNEIAALLAPETALPRRDDRFAILASSPLLRNQLRRFNADPDRRYFESEAEALDWLDRS